MKALDVLALLKAFGAVLVAIATAYGFVLFCEGIIYVSKNLGVDPFKSALWLVAIAISVLGVRHGYEYYEDVHKLKLMQRSL